MISYRKCLAQIETEANPHRDFNGHSGRYCGNTSCVRERGYSESEGRSSTSGSSGIVSQVHCWWIEDSSAFNDLTQILKSPRV
jgi:hypothetical protein